MQPPEGPPICAALNCLPLRDAAADVVDQLAQRHADRAPRPGRCCSILPASAKTLVPRLFAVPMRGVPVAAVQEDRRHVGDRSRRCSAGSACPTDPLRPGTAAAGAARRDCPRSRSSARVSSPQTNAPEPMRISTSKSNPVPRMFLPSRPRSRGLGDGDAEPFDGQRILGADVDVALRRRRSCGRRWPCPRSRCADRLPARCGP